MTDVDDTPRFGAAPASDDDLDRSAPTPPKVQAAAGSPLEALRQEAQRQVGHGTVTLAVHERPGWSVRYRADLEVTQLNLWRKKCKDRSMPDGVDELKLACIILANHCDALILNGEELEDDEGLVTFGSQSFLESFGVTRPIDAVKAWYGSDGHVMSASHEVVIESGFGDEAEHADPTPGSSRR